MKSRMGWTYALACVAVILCGFAGTVVGATIGNAIAPARLDWSAQSTPGLLFVGAVLGLVGGIAFGVWVSVKVVRDARARRPVDPASDTLEARATRRRRAIVTGAATAAVLAALIVSAAWPEPICDQAKRDALVAVAPFGDARARVRDMPIEEGASAPGGCEIAYTVGGSADEIAEYYARSLDRLGWSNGLVTSGLLDEFQPINDDPYRIWIERHGWGPVPEALTDLHYGVTITELGTTSVRVHASVIRYHCAYC